MDIPYWMRDKLQSNDKNVFDFNAARTYLFHEFNKRWENGLAIHILKVMREYNIGPRYPLPRVRRRLI